MRKIASLFVVLVFASAMMFAQSQNQASSPQNSSSPTPGGTEVGGSGSTTNPDVAHRQAEQADQGQSASTSDNNRNQSSNAKVKGEKTVEGCIVQQGTEFFLQPKHGKVIRLNSSGEDLTAHVGHRVKLHGTEQRAGSAGNVGNTMGASSQPSTSGTGAPEDHTYAGNPPTGKTPASSQSQEAGATPSGQSSTSASNAGSSASTTPSSSEQASNASSENSGNLPQSSSNNANTGSNASSTSSSSGTINPNNVSNKEFTVTRVDMVSMTCPWNGGNNSNNNNNNSTTPR
jgi:hypothetical protein